MARPLISGYTPPPTPPFCLHNLSSVFIFIFKKVGFLSVSRGLPTPHPASVRLLLVFHKVERVVVILLLDQQRKEDSWAIKKCIKFFILYIDRVHFALIPYMLLSIVSFRSLFLCDFLHILAQANIWYLNSSSNYSKVLKFLEYRNLKLLWTELQ